MGSPTETNSPQIATTQQYTILIGNPPDQWKRATTCQYIRQTAGSPVFTRSWWEYRVYAGRTGLSRLKAVLRTTPRCPLCTGCHGQTRWLRPRSLRFRGEGVPPLRREAILALLGWNTTCPRTAGTRARCPRHERARPGWPRHIPPASRRPQESQTKPTRVTVLVSNHSPAEKMRSIPAFAGFVSFFRLFSFFSANLVLVAAEGRAQLGGGALGRGTH